MSDSSLPVHQTDRFKILLINSFLELEDQRDQIQLELRRSKLQRNDSYLKKHTDELMSEMEVLRLENHNLKDMIREKDEILDNQMCSNGDVVNKCVTGNSEQTTDTTIISKELDMQSEHECRIEYV